MEIIPSKLYKKIVELVPILCVDIILTYKEKFILVKRATEPLKGEWWVVGGRAFKGEKTINTARRKVREELGLKIKNLQFEGVYEDSYAKSAWGIPTSSFSAVYYGEVDTFNPKPDKTITKIKLSDELPDRFIRKLKRI